MIWPTGAPHSVAERWNAEWRERGERVSGQSSFQEAPAQSEPVVDSLRSREAPRSSWDAEDASAFSNCSTSVAGEPSAEGEKVKMAKLESLVPGLAEVVVEADLLQLADLHRGNRQYIELICKWIVENDATRGSELLENADELVEYSGMVRFSAKRFRAALAKRYCDPQS
jgi:hypothetical protein